MEDTVFSDDDSEVNTITFHAPKYVVNILNNNNAASICLVQKMSSLAVALLQ